MMNAPSGRLSSDQHTPMGSTWAGMTEASESDVDAGMTRVATLACAIAEPMGTQTVNPSSTVLVIMRQAEGSP